MSFNVILFLIMIPHNAYAQSFDKDVTARAVDGIVNVTSSIISDSFTPMTHFSKGNWTVSVVPAYFDISRVFDDPDVRGHDLRGFSLGLGGGYAVTDRWMAYGIAAFLKTEGTLTGKFYDSGTDYRVKADYSLYSFHGGMGYDIIEDSKWSMPVFGGLSLQGYSADIAFPESVPGTDATVSGSGVIAGINIGIALSRTIFDYFRITPYFLFIQSFNHPELEADLTFPLPPGSATQTVSMKTITAGMLGLNCSIIPSDSFSVNFSLGGLFTSGTRFYNRVFLDGLEMLSIVVSVTYRGGLETVSSGEE